MSCKSFETSIALHAGGDLEVEKVADCEAHLRSCAACLETFESIRETRRLLRFGAWQPEYERALEAAKASALRRVNGPGGAQSSQRSEPRWLLALAASISLALALAFLLKPETRPSFPLPSQLAAETATSVLADQLTAAREGGLGSIRPPAGPSILAPRASLPKEPIVAGAQTPGTEGGSVPAHSKQNTLTSLPSEPTLIKLVSNDLDLVIYWFVDADESNEETQHEHSTI